MRTVGVGPVGLPESFLEGPLLRVGGRENSSVWQGLDGGTAAPDGDLGRLGLFS